MLKKYKQYDELIKSRLTQKRYEHSVNVAEKSAALAEKYSADVDKAYLAGLLHDICKDETNENLLKMCNDFGIILDNVSLKSPKLWHAYAGSGYLKEILGIKDAEIINAVYYHTTGRADMTDIEKIVYLADIISDERNFSGVEEIRKSADISLDYGVFSAVKFGIANLCKRECLIHPESLNTYNFYLEKIDNC